ncbi:hypothetical protein AB6A40_003116 [Gnathostoma spinigerum]|uniref:UPAR/Ly6 domain-containing protein n=1 Tax=Gnathostoma spinigerum TaxID=75299 RepID=A0ABD6EAV8_9BILA
MQFYHWIMLLSCSTAVFSLKCYEVNEEGQKLKECNNNVKYCYRLDGIVFSIRGVITGCAASSFRPLCQSDGCRDESGHLEPVGMFKGKVCCCSKDGCNGAPAIGASAALFLALFTICQLLCL